jgi:hypothetical protein
MCHYPSVFLEEILSHTAPVSARDSRRFLRIAICAVASQSHRSRIAVALPSHRIAAASLRWRVADFIKITFASGASDALNAD